MQTNENNPREYVIFIHKDHRAVIERMTREERSQLFEMLLFGVEPLVIPNNRAGDKYLEITAQNERFDAERRAFQEKRRHGGAPSGNKNAAKKTRAEQEDSE